MANFKVQVTAQSLYIRAGAGTSTAQKGVLHKGDVVEVSGKTNGMYKLANGQGYIGANAQYTKVLANSTPPKQTQTKNQPTKNYTAMTANSTSKSAGLDKAILDMLYYKTANNNSKLNASTRLFGAPFQFTRETDFRLKGDEYDLGRKYMENIVSESPIVYFMPGRPNYLPDLNEAQKTSFTNFFAGKENMTEKDNIGPIQQLLASLGKTDTRYFGFLSDYANYVRYVNLLCRVCAIFLGIGNRKAPNTETPYKYYDWGNYRYENTYKQKTEKIKSVFDLSKLAESVGSYLYEQMFGNYQYTQFYVDPNISFTESASNNTMQSKLASTFESAQGIIKEVAFLTDTMAVKGVDTARASFSQGMEEISQKMLKNGNENFFSRLMGMSANVLEGSNIIFPELWGEASYNKSYNITINLVSPYGDKESIYLNIIVPLMHILALALPRQTTANSYKAPFMVKVFSKGWFSCEMGIIDNITIDKGGNGAWTVDGLPSEVKVNIGIKDLYSNLMQTPNSEPFLFIQNHGLIEFLSVTSGMDITKPHFATAFKTLVSVFLNNFSDIPENAYRDLIQYFRNKYESVFKV